jgi:predicted unusual protein kinase regulating ubiquinone biosynthesis (AarF/ABC1/UbiB family)
VHRRASTRLTEEANCRAGSLAVQTRRVAEDGIRGGRLSRGLPLTGLAVRQGLGRVAGKLTRDEQKQLDRFTREAERYVAVLGDMKGVAMKVGQLLSFLDAGAIPEQHRAAYQQIVGALQADAPPMPFDTVRDVLERELMHAAEETFAWIGERPMAAASIGQVHAAHLPDGREVVVKVQYPGVGDAIRADLQNTELIASIARLGAKLSPIRMTADPTAIAEEITARVTEELDYRIEAANQMEFHAHYDGHPFIRIPEVAPELSTERILVMDHHDGLRWTAALEQPQALKDTWGEVIYRFVYGSLYDFGAFNADPHPGNYLFHDDGEVTFLDFGCVKRFPAEQTAAMRRISQSVFEDGDAGALFQCFVDLGCIPRSSKLLPQRVFDWWAPIWDPGRGAQPFTFTPEFAAWVMERNFDPFGEWGDIARGMGIRPESKDWVFLTRIQLGLYSVLGALRATSDWRAVHDELRKGDPPETDLGRQHQTWKPAQTHPSGG